MRHEPCSCGAAQRTHCLLLSACTAGAAPHGICSTGSHRHQMRHPQYSVPLTHSLTRFLTLPPSLSLTHQHECLVFNAVLHRSEAVPHCVLDLRNGVVVGAWIVSRNESSDAVTPLNDRSIPSASMGDLKLKRCRHDWRPAKRCAVGLGENISTHPPFHPPPFTSPFPFTPSYL